LTGLKGNSLSRPLNCPNADGILQPVAAHDRQGALLALDQCDHCGGVWFDRYELFKLGEAEAEKIDVIDETRFRQPSGEHPDPLCPRCGISLERFRDANIPDNIQMLNCGQCGGFWVNHGEIAAYAEYRIERGRRQVDPKLAAAYEQMLKAESGNNLLKGMGEFGHFIGGPRDFLTGLPLDGTPAQTARIDQAQDFFFAALGVAARLLFWWL
jgi:Zn-finger nucleic acid-binding protein